MAQDTEQDKKPTNAPPPPPPPPPPDTNLGSRVKEAKEEKSEKIQE